MAAYCVVSKCLTRVAGGKSAVIDIGREMTGTERENRDRERR